MKIETAKELNDVLFDILGRMNESIKLVMKDDTADEEFTNFKFAMGNVMGHLSDVIIEIHHKYPEIKPV
jgi:hypothetical protein